jgi:hypothetical protein
MRTICPIGILAALSLLPTLLLAEDFQNAKLIDIAPYRQSNAPIIAPNNGYPVLIPTDQNMITITVALNGMSYSANFRQSRDFKSSTLVVGDSILARLDGDKLVLRKPNGKEIKATVTRRARLEPKP